MLVHLTNNFYSTKHVVEDLVSEELFDLRHRLRISVPSAGGGEGYHCYPWTRTSAGVVSTLPPTYRGLAALATMAWRAYSQSRSGPVHLAPSAALKPSPTEKRIVLRAVLAAARVDGHIDEREQLLIDQEIARLGGDASLRAWIEDQLRTPLDPRSIAADVAGDALLASEVYLASALAIGETGFLERAYLDGLAEHLGLDGDLKRRLEADALSNQPA